MTSRGGGIKGVTATHSAMGFSLMLFCLPLSVFKVHEKVCQIRRPIRGTPAWHDDRRGILNHNIEPACAAQKPLVNGGLDLGGAHPPRRDRFVVEIHLRIRYEVYPLYRQCDRLSALNHEVWRDRFDSRRIDAHGYLTR